MCGIAGIVGGGTAAEVETMVRAIAHRGPDGQRVETFPGAILGHARLSIIDLEHGWQPLSAAGCTVVGNGEIYNYRELIAEHGLEASLATASDFEPLLHLYAREGERAFERLRGMYAFCLVGCDGRVWLVRDPFGIKPLYYTAEAGQVRFASEPRALLTGRPEIEAAQIEQLLTLGYEVGEATPFAGVRRLEPGAIVEVTGGVFAPRSVGAAIPKPKATKPTGDESALVAALDKVLEDSVGVHLRSDVPYGLFLSGGVDSAAIATLMARLSPGPVTTFTCGFAAAGPTGVADERKTAERVARALNLDWRPITFDEEDFWRVLPKLAEALDEPTTDYAALPTYKLAEAAKGTLTVVLTGEGGDELFAGYGRYRRALRPRWLGGRDAGPRATMDLLSDNGAAAVAAWRADTAPPPSLTRLQQAQARDIAGWLPSDLLLKLDRCLMAHGLEGRTPFLDPDVARFAFPLPDRFKLRGRLGKWLLRLWLEKHCPAAEPFARKSGFTTPVQAWIAPRAPDLGPRIANVEAIRRLCDPDKVRAVFTDDRQAKHRWPLLFLAVWSGIHEERLTPRDALARLGV